MARPLRSQLPDGIYHATTRGVASTLVFRDRGDRLAFLAVLAGTVERFEWRLHALCLMGTHYHVVVETTRERLSRGMHRLNGVYAQAYNDAHGRAGHLFGDRFVSRVVDGEEYLRRAVAYVLENPVKAGLCDDPADWPWSWARYDLRAGPD